MSYLKCSGFPGTGLNFKKSENHSKYTKFHPVKSFDHMIIKTHSFRQKKRSFVSVSL